MQGVNKVIILGTLGRDPEVRYSPSGQAVANLSIATSRKWKDKKTQDYNEETEWHRIVMYDKQAELAGEYLKKGSKLYVEGRLKTRKWQDKQGKDNYTTEVVCEQMTFLDGKRESEPANAPRSAPRSAPAPKTGTGFDDMGDDIPW